MSVGLLAAMEVEDAEPWFAPSELPDLPRTGRLSVDVETKDPQLTELGPGVRRPELLGQVEQLGRHRAHQP